MSKIDEAEGSLPVLNDGDIGFHRLPGRIYHAIEEEGEQYKVGDCRRSFKNACKKKAKVHEQLEDYQHRFPSDAVSQLASYHGTGNIEYGGKGHVGSRLQG
ncbi:hypothetical protein SDC9_133346 [bioreactor metagenome]|uniref:Uncharacterized protein n=1 Tax=bioreactor metagenome TaxID=1076179 RepID=A0A645DAN7_9ZZZZ